MSFDWSSLPPLKELLGPAVIAAVISVIGGGAAIFVTWWNHKEKIRVDVDLARQRQQAEIHIAELKAKLDFDLAVRKADLERQEALAKRNAEFAETVLMAFLKARELIAYARSPASLSGEGKSRDRMPGETDSMTSILDSYYATAERLHKQSDFFVELEGHRLRFLTLFGDAAAEPFDELREIKNRILIAVRMLMMRSRSQSQTPGAEKWENTIWGVGDREDEIAQQVSAIVSRMEAICRPLISRPPARTDRRA